MKVKGISVGMYYMGGASIFNKKKTNPDSWEKWDMSPDANHLFIVVLHYKATLEKNKVKSVFMTYSLSIWC